jgi:hypothetical protein
VVSRTFNLSPRSNTCILHTSIDDSRIVDLADANSSFRSGNGKTEASSVRRRIADIPGYRMGGRCV